MAIEDAEAVGRLHRAGWQTAYRGLVHDAYLDALDLEEGIARHRKHVAERGPDHRMWVSEADGRVTGFCVTGPNRDADLPDAVHELFAIYVTPAQVGQGHGRALIVHALADIDARGYEETVLWTLVGNERAERFYRIAGFEPDSRVTPTPHRDSGADKHRWVRR